MIAEDTQYQLMATIHHDIHTRWEYPQVICSVHPRWSQIQNEEVDVVAKSGTWCEIKLLALNKIANATKSNQCKDEDPHNKECAALK